MNRPQRSHESVLNEAVFESVLENFRSIVDKTGSHLRMDSVMISQGDTVFRRDFTDDPVNDLRSVSKPTLCLAIGIALEEGLILRGQRIGLDTAIWPFFEEKVELRNLRNRHSLSRVKLRHLLNHTIGYDVGLMFSKDLKDRDPDRLLDYIFNTEIIHEPGSRFVYSNVGPYIFSALIGEELGVNLSTWVERHLFNKIGISNYNWKNYGPYCAACTGLRLSMSDLHTIAKLLVNDGRFEGQQVVPAAWVAAMRRPQVETPTMYDESRVFPKYAYGYYLYICKNGTYYCDGTDGQYLIVLPKSSVVITTFGHQSDMKPITECLRPLLW